MNFFLKEAHYKRTELPYVFSDSYIRLMNRSSFVKKLLVFLGFSSSTNVLLSSCEKGETLLEVEEELSAEEKAYKELKENIGENGFFLDGKILNVDLTHKNYLKLQTTGEFINDSENYVLLLRKTEEDILALSNCCPHLGTSNRWSYSNGEFRCANHGNSYGTGIGFAANCSSNSTSGNLKQYKTEINQDILIVNFDT